MNFSKALELLKKEKKIRRKEWECMDTYIAFIGDDMILKLIDDTEEFSALYYHLCLDDILADDWEEYKDPLLTEEEKEYLKMIIKFHPEAITSILVCFRKDYNLVYFEYKDDADCVVTTKDYFKNLKEDHSYVLEELGL